MTIPSDPAAYDLDRHPECAHIGLVFRHAHRTLRRFDGRLPGLEFDDLLQVGYLALQCAHARYEPALGDYAPYVERSIRRDLWQAVSLARCQVHVPVNVASAARRAHRGQALPKGMTTALAAAAHRAMNRACRCLDEAMAALAVGLDTRWIDREAIDAALARLSPREADVVRLRYGLEDGPLTFDEIGQRQGVTRGAIGAVHRRAVRRLRADADRCGF